MSWRRCEEKLVESFLETGNVPVPKLEKAISDCIGMGRKEYSIARTKAIFLIQEVNKLEKEIKEKRRINKGKWLVEAAKVKYTGSKESNKGKFWFDKAAEQIYKIVTEEDEMRREELINRLKVLAIYLRVNAR